MKRTSSSFSTIFLVLLLAVAGLAQVTSRVTGVVQDKSGAVLPNANVSLTDEATNVVFTTTTTSAGTYLFDAIKPGTYTLKVTMAGFKAYESAGNVLSIGQPLSIRVMLDVGKISEQIEVNAAAELVQTATSGNIGTLIDNKALQMLPIVGTRGRNPLELVELTPGVIDAGGFNQGGPNVQGGGVHVNGARDRAWNYTLDGIDVNETSAGGGNFSPLRTNPDMLSEFRVVTSSFTSEYGRNSGAQVEMVSRSGSNQFHGTGFFFYQTPAFMANDPGNIEQGLPRPQWVQKIPGFSFGGPIIKNKTFFFANFQWLRTLKTVHSSQPTYTPTARQGILRYVNYAALGCTDPDATACRNTPAGVAGASVDAAGNSLVPVVAYNVAANDPQHLGLDPAVLAILNKSPLPNDYTVGDGLNIAAFDWQPAEHEKQLDYTIRVDHTFNDSHAVFVRWSAGHQNTIADTVNAGSPIFPGFPNIVDTYRTPKNLAVNWRWVVNPRMLNEFTVGVNRFTFNFANPDPNYLKEPAFNFYANPICANDGICLQMPLQNYLGNLRKLTTYQLVDNFSYTRGPHALKFGINFRYQRHIDDRGSIGNLNGAAAINFDPNYTSFTSFTLPSNINSTYDIDYLKGSINDLLGRVGSIQQGIVQLNNNQWAPPGTHLRADFRMPEYDFFAQDSWRLKPNLVVDLGLRWEIKPSPRVTNADTMLRPNGPLGFGYSSDSLTWVRGSLYKNAWKDFGPSIGFAWDPHGNGKMSVRGNYRIAYDRMNTFSLSSTVFQGFPGQIQQVYDTSYAAGGGRLSQLTPALYDSIINSYLTQPPSALRTPDPFTENLITVVDPNWTPPQTHMWSLGIQHELPWKMVAEMDYVGRKGVHLYGASDANQAEIRNNGFLDAFKVLQAGGQSPLINRLLANDPGCIDLGLSGSNCVRDANSTYNSDFALGSPAGLALTMAQQNLPLASGGTTANFFLAYPQFAGGFITLESHDFSTYNGLQTVIRRAYSNGLTFQASYVWSKSIDTRSWDPTFSTVVGGSSPWGASSTPFDLHNRKLNYAPSDFDRTHSFQSIFVYELPFGKGRHWGQAWNGFLDRVLGGWEIGGFGIMQSGHPTTIYSSSYTLSSVVRTPANCTGCSSSMFSVHRDPATGLLTYLTPQQMNLFSTPGPGEYSNVGRNFFRLAPYKNLSMSVGKKTKITERQTFEMRLEVQNVTNSVMYDEPASNRYTSSVFGSIDPAYVENAGRGLTSDPRKMQVSLKYSF